MAMRTSQLIALRLSIAVLLLGLAAPSHAEPVAAPLPDGVRAMIAAAIEGGDAAEIAAVVRLARLTHPAAGADIDAMLPKAAEGAAQPAAAAAPAAAPVAAAEPEKRSGLLTGWSGKGELGAFQTSGNSSSTGISAALGLSKAQGKWSWGLTATADYQRSGGITSTEQFLVELQPRYQIGERLFAYGLGRWERDPVLGLARRWSLSGGLGARLVQTEKLVVNVRGGPAWQRTELVPGPLRLTLNREQLTALTALDASWQFAPNLRLTETASAFFGPGKTNMLATTSLDLRVNSKLSTRLSYVVDHNTNPPAGSKSTDTITRFTLVYDF